MNTINAIGIAGQYLFANNSLQNPDNKTTIHIRTRKNVGDKKPAQFLAIHKPVFTYISSLYPVEITQGSVNGNLIITHARYQGDYKGQKFILTIAGDKAKIESLETK